jgi:hypothetical protein
VKKELARLERNRERRKAREKQKRGKSLIGTEVAASPEGSLTPVVEKPTGTTRKCANCGQAGHIKTNKKYCLANNPYPPVDGKDIVQPMGITTTKTKWF